MADIRWRTKDIEQLREQIERYNRKLKRLKKQGFESDVFDVSKPFSEIQKEITTRGQYNDYLSHLRNLTTKGSEKVYAPATEKGIKLTVGEANELNREIQIINKDRRKRRNEYEKRTEAKVEWLPKKDVRLMELEMKATVDKQLAKYDKYSPSQKEENFKVFKQSFKKQSDTDYIEERFEKNKQHYYDGLSKRMPSNIAYEIAKRVEAIDPEDFYYLQLEFPELSYDFMYNEPMTPYEKYELIDAKLSDLGY